MSLGSGAAPMCALRWIYRHWRMMGDTPARLCVDQLSALGGEVDLFAGYRPPPCTFGLVLCIAWG